MYVDVLMEVLVLEMVVMMELNFGLMMDIIWVILVSSLIDIVLTNILLDVYMNHLNEMMELYLMYMRLAQT